MSSCLCCKHSFPLSYLCSPLYFKALFLNYSSTRSQNSKHEYLCHSPRTALIYLIHSKSTLPPPHTHRCSVLSLDECKTRKRDCSNQWKTLTVAFAEHFIPSRHQLRQSSSDTVTYFIEEYRCKGTVYSRLW